MSNCSTLDETFTKPAANLPGKVAPVVAESLNIPEELSLASCDCEKASDLEAMESDFDRGVRAMLVMDYSRADTYFRSHSATGDEIAKREARIGLNFMKLLNGSLSEDSLESGRLHGHAQLMAMAIMLQSVVEKKLDKVDRLNKTLASDLKKREELLQRLRELTLGQSSSD